MPKQERNKIVLEIGNFRYVIIKAKNRLGKAPKPNFWGLYDYALKSVSRIAK